MIDGCAQLDYVSAWYNLVQNGERWGTFSVCGPFALSLSSERDLNLDFAQPLD
jgi:hypothetical protein